MEATDTGLRSRVGHTFSHTTASGNSRVHLGDVYNYHDSNFADKPTLDWLTSLDPSQSHNQALTQFQHGTLEWFFEDDRYHKWRHDWDHTTPWLLWCRGDMGTGKTTLIAQILCHLRSTNVPRGDLAVVYCRYTERDSQTLENVVGSILAQLFERSERGFQIPSAVVNAQESQPTFLKSRPTSTQLQTWLHQRLEAMRPIFILLDALDELHDVTRRKLLQFLRSINDGRLRLLVTSRDASIVENQAFHYQQIRIYTHKEDLQTLVRARLHEEGTENFQQLVSNVAGRHDAFATIEDEISFKVTKSARNMFIYADMTLTRILECTRIADVYHYLDTMPADLDSLYDEAWERATSGHGSLQCSRATKILMWVAFSKQRLSVKVLGEALAASGHGSSSDPLTSEDIASICAGLIRVERVSIVARAYYHNRETSNAGRDRWEVIKNELFIVMTHLSAHRYLEERRHDYFPHADDDIVSACLAGSTSGEIDHAFRRYSDSLSRYTSRYPWLRMKCL
ncbi:hypothetical protein Q7P37_003786 [Cladosporium fusiforme]